MRIDAIRITGLASLREAQPDIVLNAPPLQGAGLIAITGPTGAGKSTILDAVCLALYGNTPRIVRGKENASELLSRGAGAGQAEVDITLDDGRRWRATWSVATAKRKAGAKVQQAQMRLLDLDGDRVVAEGVGECREQVRKAIGLDFAHFTSVILLAQGQFANFLAAKDGERAEILERLTGTGLYARLGKLAWDEAKEAERAVDEKSARINEVQVLDEAARLVLAGEAAGGVELVAAAKIRAEKTAAVAAWWERDGQLGAAVATAEAVVATAQAAFGAAEGERGRLTLARAAQELAPQVTALRQSEERQRMSTAALATATKNLSAAGATATALRGDLALALGGMDAAGRQARARLEHCAGMAAATPERTAAARAACERVAAARQGRVRAAAALAEAERAAGELGKRAQAATALAERTRAAADVATAAAAQAQGEAERAAGAEGLPGLAARSERLATCRALLRDFQAIDRAGARDRVAGTALIARENQAKAEAATAAAAAMEAQVAEENHLLHLATIGARAAGMRHVLIEGQPCPLCGALAHPFAAGGAPDADRTLTAAHERLATRTRALAGARMAAERALAAAQDAGTAAAAARSRQEAVMADGERLATAWTAARTGGALTALAASIGEQDATALDGLVAQAQAGVTAAAAAAERAVKLRKDAEKIAIPAHQAAVAAGAAQSAAGAGVATVAARVAEVATEAERVMVEEGACLSLVTALAVACAVPVPVPEDGVTAWVERMARQHEEWRAARDAVRQAEEAVKELVEPAHALLNPSEVLAGAGGGAPASASTGKDVPAVGPARAALARALERARAAEAAVKRAEDAARGAEQAAADAESARVEAAQHLDHAIAGGPFGDRAAVAAATLTAPAITALAERLARIDLDLHTATVRRDDAATVLREHRENPADGRSIDGAAISDAVTAKAAAALAQAELLRVAGAAESARVRLQADDAQRARRAGMEAELEQARAALKRAAALRDVVGSADGDAFRRFAQTLTLDQLLSLANRRLERFAPRYRLMRALSEDARPSLDLTVVDLDLAGERRPIATLSGGETFLVSLALALALADLRRGNRPLGTLFLDEGFGTLDAEALDGAIATLEEIQAAQGTQILIISHVGGLQDRLACIAVRKLGGGRSELSVVLPTTRARAVGTARVVKTAAPAVKPATKPLKKPVDPPPPREAAKVDGAGVQEKLF
jgi:exonuclease SbcC